ncbi:CHAT domain-containing protein, partial [Prochlorococcus marinus]
LDSKSKKALLFRGTAKYQIKDYSGAILDFSVVLKLEPKDEEALLFRGLAKTRLSNQRGAIEDYSQIITINPENVAALESRGIGRVILKDYKNAINDFNRILELEPKNYVAFAWRGNAKGELKDFENALKDFKQALKINKDYKDALDFKSSLEKKIALTNKIEGLDQIWSLQNQIQEYKTKKEYKKVIESYKKIFEIESRINRQTSFPLSSIAYHYEKLGEYENALNYQWRAIKLEESISGKDSIKVANLLSDLAFLYQGGKYYLPKEKFEEVFKIYNRVLKIKENEYGINSIQVAATYQNIASLYSAKANWEKAIELREKAIDILSKVKDPKDFYTSVLDYKGFLFSQISYDLVNAGNLIGAKSYAQKSLGIKTKLYPKDHEEIAGAYESLGSIFYYLGDFAKSQSYINSALKIYKKDNKKYKLELDSLQKLDQIITYLIAAKEGKKTTFKNSILLSSNMNEDDPEASLKLTIDSVYLTLRGSFDKAINLLEKKLKLIEKNRGIDNFDFLRTLSSIGEIYIFNGDIIKAEEYLERALENYNLYFNTNIINNEILELYQRVATLYILKKDSKEAEKFIEKTIESSIIFAKEQSQYLAESDRKNFASLILSPYETLFTVIDELPNGKQLALKARINRQGLLEDIERYQSSFSNLKNEEKEIAYEIKQLNIKLSDVLLNKEDSQKLSRKKKKLEEKLYSKLPSLKPRIIEIQEIKDLLPENSALIEFQKYRSLEINKRKNSSSNNLGDYKYIALILKSDGEILKINLGQAEEIENKINEVLISIENINPNSQDLLEELGNLIIKPLEKAIKNTNTIFIAPDAELNRIPFAAIGSYETNKLLGELKEVRLLTTGRELIELARNKLTSKKNSLVVANPKFDLTKKSLIINIEDNNSPQKRSGILDNRNWQELKGTIEEGEIIASLLNGKLLMQEEATSIAIQETQSPKVIHIASHSYFVDNKDEKNPLLRSGIVLAGANNPKLFPNDDGYLTGLEITRLNWQGTELVVISGCESGKGDSESGEGLFGLKRAISVAGGRSSILSLWEVDDGATASFMKSFYKKLINGDDKATALKKTQNEFKKHPIPGFRHPYFWSAFQLSGDWNKI